MPDAPYPRQLFVCTYGAWCRIDGSEEIRAKLKDAVKAARLQNDVRVTKSGCLGQCGNGPMAVLWPDNVWYCKVKLGDVDELVEEQIRNLRPVERLRYRPAKPGSNKTEAVKAREAERGANIE